MTGNYLNKQEPPEMRPFAVKQRNMLNEKVSAIMCDLVFMMDHLFAKTPHMMTDEVNDDDNNSDVDSLKQDIE